MSSEDGRLQRPLPLVLSLADFHEPRVLHEPRNALRNGRSTVGQFHVHSYLDLFAARLERVNSDNLLETIETYDDEAVLQLGSGGLLRVDLVQEEAIERQRLFVNDVAPAGGWIGRQATPAARRRPVVAERRLLQNEEPLR